VEIGDYYPDPGMLHVIDVCEATGFYDSRAVVKLNLNSFSTTRGNKFKLQNCNCHYDIRKYSCFPSC